MIAYISENRVNYMQPRKLKRRNNLTVSESDLKYLFPKILFFIYFFFDLDFLSSIFEFSLCSCKFCE